MAIHEIKIEWKGPCDPEEVVEKMNDEGVDPEYGDDYGLYQIYGRHLLYGYDALLYIGQNIDQTFSARIKQEQDDWIKDEKDIKIFLGRVYDPRQHTSKDNWESWELDIDMAESILIYKYCPNYNSKKISNKPSLEPHEKITLIHYGNRYRIEKEDNAPEDFDW